MKGAPMSLDRRVVDRMYSVLVEEIRNKAPAYLAGEFTVAEIYQSLVPYRTHRDRIGVEINGDYEDALLRLLGGEGGYLELLSDAALARIRKEIGSPNPNTGVFRDFAAVGVRLDPDRIPPEGEAPTRSGASEKAAESDPPVAEAGAELDLPLTVPDYRHPLPERPEDASAHAAASRAPQGGTDAAGAPAPAECPDCGEALPRRAGLRFCPFCGTDVLERPCGACGEPLERGWAYCVACGADARA